MHTTAPVVGVPFTGTTVMSTNVDGQGRMILKVRIIRMRDSAGRTRTETHGLEMEGMPAQRPDERTGQIEVEVNDTVRHCNFTWTEPARTEADRTASVRCGPRTVTLMPDVEMEGRMTRQVAETTHPFPWETMQIEPLGEKVIAGVKAVGIRQTETDSRVKDSTPQVTEMWWSPEIKELLEAKSIEGVAVGPILEMTDIKRQDPDPALFYPPAGFKIVAGRPAN